MSYDFSFEKSQMWLLGLLTTLMAVLLVTAGFLMGRISIAPSASTTAAAPVVQTSQPAVKVSASPGLTAPVVRVPGATMTLAASTTAAGSAAPAESTQDVVQLTSLPAEANSTVAINTASSSSDVYHLTATGYALQYGAFRDPANARDLMKQLTEQKVIASVVTMQNAYGESYSVVRSGAYPTVSDARQAAVDQANRLRMPIVVRPAGRL